MQVTETLNSGLKREIKVTVPARDLEAKLMARLSDAKNKVRINGFRPGKVPVQHLRKVYGKSFMAEVVNEILSNSTREILSDRGEKAAMQPEVVMTEDEKEAEKILAGNADFEFKLNYEVIPAIEIQDFSGIKVTRQVYDVPEADIEEQVHKVTADAREYEVKKARPNFGTRSQSTISARSTVCRLKAARQKIPASCWVPASSSLASRSSLSASKRVTKKSSP